jgi:hypothetical protein
LDEGKATGAPRRRTGQQNVSLGRRSAVARKPEKGTPGIISEFKRIMNRRSFAVSVAGAALAAAAPCGVFAELLAAKVTTQNALFDALPRPSAGEWVRLIMGSGVAYQKQIGLATETTESGVLHYVETQIGIPGGSCNPNTMKRVYLEGGFGSLMAQPAVLANVADSGTILTRWGDVGGGQTQVPSEAHLRLLDLAYLYDDRPVRVVSSAPATLTMPFGALATTHVVGEFVHAYDAKHRLARIELWTAPGVPFGVAKYRATREDGQTFDLHLFSHGKAFKPELAMTLETVRAVTPGGTYVRTT